MNSDQVNPKFIIALAYVNGDGEVVRFVKADGEDYKDIDYPPIEEEKKRIAKDAFLMSENYCRWKLVDGKWKCLPV